MAGRHKLSLEKITYLLNNKNIKLIDEYITCNTKTKFECLIDGYQWETTPCHIFYKTGCPKCSNPNLNLNNNDVDKRMSNKNIKRIGECKGIHVSLEWECKKDGYKWNATPSYIFNKPSCPKCLGKLPITFNDFDNILIDKFIVRKEEYKGIHTKINFQCKKCNYLWKTKPKNILDGYGCQRCGGSIKLTNEDVDKRLENRNIKRIDEYINTDTKINFQCVLCNHIWNSRPNDIFSGYGCPFCSIGKGERHCESLITQYCKYDKIEHPKYIFINNKQRKPDFYLEIGNKNIIIEYNGKQHYKPVRFGGISKERAEDKFIKQQNRDEELRIYCKENNIILLEIPYTWKEDKIIEELEKLNTTSSL